MEKKLRRQSATSTRKSGACTLLAAQRHCKVLGIFTRLHRRDGKPVYLRHIPRVARLLRETVESTPALAELGAWLRAQSLL